MKKHYIKILSFLLSFIFLFFSLFSSPVYAKEILPGSNEDTPVEYNGKTYFSMSTFENATGHFFDQLAGFLGNFTGLIPGVESNVLQENFRSFMTSYYNFNEIDLPWWIACNMKVDVEDVSNNTEAISSYYLSDGMVEVLSDFTDWYKSKCDNEQVWRYYTTYTPSDFDSTQFPIASSYTNFRSRLINESSKDIYTIFLNAANGYGGLLYHIDSLSNNGFVVTGMPIYAACLKHEWTGFQEDTPVKVSYFDFYQNMYITGDTLGDLLEDLASRGLYRNDCLVFHDPEGNEVLSPRRGYPDFVNFQPQGIWTFEKGSSFTRNTLYFMISGTHQKFMVFESIENLIKWQTEQLRPGYYTIDPTVSSNVISKQAVNNGVNYGDIVGGNQYKIIIGPGNRVEPIVTPNPDDGGGGGGTIPDPNPDPGPGGGGGGTDPGNWDFSGLLRGLMSLIQAVFNLISSLVGYIAELLGELITAITGLIDRLKLLVTGGVMELFTAFFAWLPPEVASLISLSFLLGVIIAIIRFIRG